MPNYGGLAIFIKTKDKNNKLGTPIQAIDKTGKVVWAADYNAFGQATINANDITSNLRLLGQYFDAETGRYITSDPIGLAGCMNRYAYAIDREYGFKD